jgi:hypothetical protein
MVMFDQHFNMVAFALLRTSCLNLFGHYCKNFKLFGLFEHVFVVFNEHQIDLLLFKIPSILILLICSSFFAVGILSSI